MDKVDIVIIRCGSSIGARQGGSHQPSVWKHANMIILQKMISAYILTIINHKKIFPRPFFFKRRYMDILYNGPLIPMFYIAKHPRAAPCYPAVYVQYTRKLEPVLLVPSIKFVSLIR